MRTQKTYENLYHLPNAIKLLSRDQFQSKRTTVIVWTRIWSKEREKVFFITALKIGYLTATHSFHPLLVFELDY